MKLLYGCFHPNLTENIFAFQFVFQTWIPITLLWQLKKRTDNNKQWMMTKYRVLIFHCFWYVVKLESSYSVLKFDGKSLGSLIFFLNFGWSDCLLAFRLFEVYTVHCTVYMCVNWIWNASLPLSYVIFFWWQSYVFVLFSL